MRTSSKLFFLAAATALTACTQETEETPYSVAARITAGVSGPATRAVDNKWNADHIGVMVTSHAGTTMGDKYKNVEYQTASILYTADFTPATAGNGIFFEDGSQTYTFAAYAPYASSADNSTLPGTGGKVAVSTSSQPTATDQEKIDYIYASGATATKNMPTISFTNNTSSGGADCAFKHKMARLVINVQVSNTDGLSDVEVLRLADYKLGGLIHEGTFDVTTGTATATGTAVGDWMLRKCTGAGSERTAADNCVANFVPSQNKMTLTMILLPQTLADALVFEVSPNDGEGQTYANTTDIKPELMAGYSYTYTITVKKSGLVISGSTIESWNSGGTTNGEAIMK